MESNSCPNIVLAAPSQNRPGFELAVERAMPFLAARQLGGVSHLKWLATDLWRGVIDTRKKLVSHVGQNGLFGAVLVDRPEVIKLRDRPESMYG